MVQVLMRPKFHLTEDIVSNIVDSLEKVAVFVDAEPVDIELPDPEDRVFYEVVMEERKDEDAYLVTGNIRHFPDKTFAVTPRTMLDIILKDMQDSQSQNIDFVPNAPISQIFSKYLLTCSNKCDIT